MPRFRLALAAATLAVAALTAPVQAADEPLTPDQKTAVEDIVRQYLRDNPEVLVEAIQALREKQETAQREQQRQALIAARDSLERDGQSPVVGNPEGDVTVVEFFDYNCIYCKRMSPAIKEMIETDGNIRFVFKELPVLGPDSLVAARVALAIWRTEPDKYDDFHFAVMAGRGKLTEPKVFAMAEEVGLDAGALRDALKDPGIDRLIEQTRAVAQSVGIEGTPAFVIGDHLVPGAVAPETLSALIARARGSGG